MPYSSPPPLFPRAYLVDLAGWCPILGLHSLSISRPRTVSDRIELAV